MNFLKIAEILNYPYPKTNNLKDVFFQSVYVAVFVYLFLALFQPFGTYNVENSYKYLILIPYSVIAFTIFSSIKYTINSKIQHWNISREIITIIGILSVCSVLNYFYSMNIIHSANFRFYNLFFMFFCTFSVGMPICLIYFFGSLALSKAKENHKDVENDDIKNEKILEFKTFKVNDLVINNINENFIFAKSEGNYCQIYYYQNSKIEKKLFRISISNLENKVLSDRIVRCHRSYIINKKYISSKKGNAQGYKLTILEIEETVPVSRKYLNTLN